MTPTNKSEIDEPIQASSPGAYPWDLWQREALDAGLAPELAALGRSVMREAYQHDWCDRLKYECGINNPHTAAGMILCAKDQPFLTETRWQWLLATDGLRFDPWERAEWSEDDLEWNQMLKRWQAERAAENPLSAENQTFRDAVDYLIFFYKLDQLAIIDLERHAMTIADGKKTFWADFTIIDSRYHEHHRTRSGVVRIDQENAGHTAVFERVEES